MPDRIVVIAVLALLFGLLLAGGILYLGKKNFDEHGGLRRPCDRSAAWLA